MVVSVHFLLVWRTWVRHWNVVLTTCVRSYWGIFVNMLAWCVSKTVASIWLVKFSRVLVSIKKWSLAHWCCEVWLRGIHRWPLFVNIWNTAVLWILILKYFCSLVNCVWNLVLAHNIDLLLFRFMVLLNISEPCIKRVFGISIEIFVNFGSDWIELSLFVSDMLWVTFFDVFLISPPTWILHLFLLQFDCLSCWLLSLSFEWVSSATLSPLWWGSSFALGPAAFITGSSPRSMTFI